MVVVSKRCSSEGGSDIKLPRPLAVAARYCCCGEKLNIEARPREVLDRYDSMGRADSTSYMGLGLVSEGTEDFLKGFNRCRSRRFNAEKDDSRSLGGGGASNETFEPNCCLLLDRAVLSRLSRDFCAFCRIFIISLI